MRKTFLLALLLTSLPAAAQPVETVTVRDAALTGLWKIAVPSGFGIDILQRARFLSMTNIFCRIAQSGPTFKIDCLDGGYSRSGTGTIEGNIVPHIARGSMMARMVIDGERAGNAIDGHFVFKLSGISHEDADLSHSERLMPSAVGPDGGEKSALLKAVLEGQSAPLDKAAIT